MIKFITFKPYTEYDGNGRRIVYSATVQINEWLKENPDVEIISWQAVSVGGASDICIVVQYKENQ